MIANSLDIDAMVAKWIIDKPPVPKGKEWPQPAYVPSGSLFYVTDLAKCPRQVCYRNLGMTKRPDTDANTAMFDNANYIHWRMCRALDYAGLLVAEELRLRLPPRWGGRLDYLRRTEEKSTRVIIGDGKTKHPNWVSKTGPKQYPQMQDVFQTSAYWQFLDSETLDMLADEDGLLEPYELDDDLTEVVYMDRGGSNPSLPVFAPVLDRDMLEDRMERMETAVDYAVASKGEYLPPLMKTNFAWYRPYYSQTNGEFISGTIHQKCFQCQYCRYEMCPQVGLKPKAVGKWKKATGIKCEPGYENRLALMNDFMARDARGDTFLDELPELP